MRSLIEWYARFVRACVVVCVDISMARACRFRWIPLKCLLDALTDREVFLHAVTLGARVRVRVRVRACMHACVHACVPACVRACVCLPYA